MRYPPSVVRIEHLIPIVIVIAASSIAAAQQPPATIGPPADAQPRPTETVAPHKDPAQARIAALNLRMKTAAARMKSMECVFHRTEYKGKQLPPTEAHVKVRTNGDVFMRITKGANEGRDILYRPKENDGKLLVSNPVFNISLGPDNFIVARSSRYTLRDAGIHKVARLILKSQTTLATLPPDAGTHEWLGPRMIKGQQAQCFRSILNKQKYPQLFAYQSEVCVSDAHHLPIHTKVWDEDKPGDGKVRLVGDYTYEKCRFDHLTDKDFDEDNPDYRF